ncbi:MAG: hypothetical protein HC790_10390 [Acaryochloridaceae cyanobacterium CSU_3_4]|nr:hypothetical protein [Acaryochloridaceae cyanobacterium CSU_3_4]
MRIWLISFLILLALTRGWDWLAHLTLPLPTLLLAGAILSILSNESILAGLPWMPQSQPSPPQLSVSSDPPDAHKTLTSR